MNPAPFSPPKFDMPFQEDRHQSHCKVSKVGIMDIPQSAPTTIPCLGNPGAVDTSKMPQIQDDICCERSGYTDVTLAQRLWRVHWLWVGLMKTGTPDPGAPDSASGSYRLGP